MINCNYKWMITRASMGYPNDWNLKNIHPRHHRRVREGRPFHLETGKIHVFTGGRSAIQHVVFTVFTMRKKGVWNQERCGFTRLYPSTWVQLLHQENCCFSDHNWWLMILHDGHKPINQANSSLSHHRQTFKSHQKMQSMTNQRMNFSEIWLISIYHGISRLYHGKSG